MNYKQCLLDPADCVLLVIDHQAQMYFGVQSDSRQSVENSVVGMVKAAKIFNVPTVLTTVTAESFAGPLISGITDAVPGNNPIDRTTLNSWEDSRVKKAVVDSGRKKVLLCGLWTEVCVAFPALSLIADGYDVYVVEDACGGSSRTAHKAAMERIIQAGGHPTTWLTCLLEFQRDWASKATYTPVTNLIVEHAGAYGIGIDFSKAMYPERADA